MRYEIEIDGWHPAKLNEMLGKHWAVSGRLKERDAMIMRTHVLMTRNTRGIPFPPPHQKRRVSLRLYGWPRGRLPDPDCWWKSTLDALVHAGVLRDDGPSHVEIGTVEYERSSQKRTIIIVEESGENQCP